MASSLLVHAILGVRASQRDEVLGADTTSVGRMTGLVDMGWSYDCVACLVMLLNPQLSSWVDACCYPLEAKTGRRWAKESFPCDRVISLDTGSFARSPPPCFSTKTPPQNLRTV